MNSFKKDLLNSKYFYNVKVEMRSKVYFCLSHAYTVRIPSKAGRGQRG